MTASIILAVGVSIISIALKQLQISTVGRESQYAFYAANTGAECALYWDFHGVLQPVSTGGAQAYQRLAVFSNPFAKGSEVLLENGDIDSVTCAGTVLAANRGITPNSTSPNNYDDSWVAENCSANDPSSPCPEASLASAFTVFLAHDPDDPTKPDKLGPCARVTVTKTRGEPKAGGGVDPKVDGSSLETVIESRGYNFCDQNNPRRVERGLRYTY